MEGLQMMQHVFIQMKEDNKRRRRDPKCGTEKFWTPHLDSAFSLLYKKSPTQL
jgi:hypothetical protein